MSKCRHKRHFYILIGEVGQSFIDETIFNYSNQRVRGSLGCLCLEIGSTETIC